MLTRVNNNRGISLAELLVAMAILAIVMAPIVTSLSSTLMSYQYNMSQGRNVMSTRDVVNAISDELRYATSISVAQGTPATVPSSTITYTVNSVSRTMYATAGTAAGTYNLVINGKTISTNNLKLITFTRSTTSTKLIDITVSEYNASYTNSPTMTTTTTLTLLNM